MKTTSAADLDRKIRALRALMERPGTAGEGETARVMLAKLLALRATFGDVPPPPNEPRATPPPPPDIVCACGATYRAGGRCRNRSFHRNIKAEIHANFWPGDTIEYSGRFRGMVRGYGDKWNEIRVRWTDGKSEKFAVFKSGVWRAINLSQLEREKEAAARKAAEEAREAARTAQQRLIDACIEHRQSLSAWRQSFLAGISQQLQKGGNLSPKQAEILEDIYQFITHAPAVKARIEEWREWIHLCRVNYWCMNTWEDNFVASVSAQIDKAGTISPKQVETLQRIYERVKAELLKGNDA
jgi:hypothetical protein